MGGAYYNRFKQGDGPTFKISIVYTTKHANSA